MWNVIEHNYKNIGGCKTFEDRNGDGGFNDFLYGRYVWRVYFGATPDQILGVTVYRTSQFGRKMVAIAAVNKQIFNELIQHDTVKSNHAYGEVSGKPEHLLGKNQNVNWINNADAGRILDRDVSLTPNSEINKSEQIPYNPNIHYYRNIGNNTFRKALYGNPINVRGNQ